MKKLLLFTLLFISFQLSAQSNNYSLDFSNSDNWISVPSINFGSDYTLQIWAKFPLPSTMDGHNTFFSDSNSGGGADIVHLFFHNICGLGIGDQYEAGNCSVSGTYGTGFMPTSVQNGWHLISVTSTSGSSTFYMDTIIVGSVNHTVSAPIVAIGNNAGGNGVAPQNTGHIDMPTIWNYALSSSEIEYYFTCPPTGSETNLVGFWNFEEGTGSIVNDLTVNGNDGTINGVVNWSSDVHVYNCCSANPITSQPTDQTVNIGDDATFDFTDSLTGATYLWQMDAGTGYSNLSNAGQFSGADTQTLTIASTTMNNNNTLYRCIVTESTSCMDTTDVSTLTVLVNTSIGELNNSLVKLFPNPSNDIITLTLAQHSNGQIILTDILGKEVLSKSFTSNEVQLNLKSLESKGTYFAKVLDIDGNVIAIKKLIYQ